MPKRMSTKDKAAAAARSQFIAAHVDKSDEEEEEEDPASGRPKAKATFEATWLGEGVGGGCAQCFFSFSCLHIS